MVNINPSVFRLKCLTLIFQAIFVLIFISCRSEKSEFETEIVKGYWLLHSAESGTPINHCTYRSCTKYTVDGRSILYGFNLDGSVDSLHILRHQKKIEWNYSKNDNVFCISSSDGYDYFKYMNIIVDTVLLEAVLCQTVPVKKGFMVHLVRYRPGCVPIIVADSNMVLFE